MALSYYVGSATQGSADAFVAAEISTALSGQTSRAARVREILYELPSIAGTSANVEVALSRREQTAMPLITDRNVIAKIKIDKSFTTSGLAEFQRILRQTFTEDDNLLLVEDPLHLVLDSNGTSAANTVRVRVGYELVNISANDRLQIALQSLNEAA